MLDGAALVMRAIAENGASAAAPMREVALSEGALLHHLSIGLAVKVSIAAEYAGVGRSKQAIIGSGTHAHSSACVRVPGGGSAVSWWRCGRMSTSRRWSCYSACSPLASCGTCSSDDQGPPHRSSSSRAGSSIQGRYIQWYTIASPKRWQKSLNT